MTFKVVLECLAIISAGIWALFYFDVLEHSFTHSNFNGGVNLTLNEWSEAKQGCLFDFAVMVENVGKQTKHIDHIKYTVCPIEAPKKISAEFEFEEIEGKCAKSPKPVATNPDFILGQTHDVHPGEKKTNVYSFIAPPQEWPWQVEAIGYADKDEKSIVFRGIDWKFCRKPK